MTTYLTNPTADLDELRAQFRPAFDKIAEANLERERARTFPHEQVRLLNDAGFGTLRIPVQRGGFGASLQQTFLLLADLGEADANVSHIWRNHLAFVEDRLNAPVSDTNDVWIDRFLGGEFVGGGWTEANNVTLANLVSTVTADGDQFRVTGHEVLCHRQPVRRLARRPGPRRGRRAADRAGAGRRSGRHAGGRLGRLRPAHHRERNGPLRTGPRTSAVTSSRPRIALPTRALLSDRDAVGAHRNHAGGAARRFCRLGRPQAQLPAGAGRGAVG